jgi:RNA polymerase sigma-70 factor (ECF subfamily)
MTPVLARRLSADRSFERLYKKHAGDVYRYALVVLRNQADAEDVTQTTFLNAYRAIERGERPRQPQNWLIAIAHNVCRQRFRHSQRRPSEVAFEEEIAESVVDEDAVTAEDIRRALGHLAFNQRAALVMRELEGRTYQEIAEILGVSVSAVETLLFRGRRALREQLEEGITCHEAGLAISKQLDGRLSRQEKGALRAHLRECDDCAGFARSQRAQRGALKALGAIPLPSSLVGLFGGGGGATAVGGGVAIKAAALAAGAALATGVSYEGVKHGLAHSARPVADKVPAQKAHPRPAPHASTLVAQEASRDQKPFRLTAVKARHRATGRKAVVGHQKRKPVAKEVSVLPPSREHVKEHVKPTHSVKPAHPTHPTHPVHTAKAKPRTTGNHGQNGGVKGKSNGKGGGGSGGHEKKTPPPAQGNSQDPAAADTTEGGGSGKSGR